LRRLDLRHSKNARNSLLHIKISPEFPSHVICMQHSETSAGCHATLIQCKHHSGAHVIITSMAATALMRNSKGEVVG
jgi:hypothetical protein